MKNAIKILLLAVLLVLGACGRNRAKETLAANINAFNRECPISLGVNGTLVSVTYNRDENIVTFNYAMNELYSLPGTDDQRKRVMASFLQGDLGRQVLEMLDAAGSAISLSYAIGTNEPVKISLTAEEVHNVATQTDDMDSARRDLADLVSIQNELCPMPLCLGLTADSISIEGKFYTYHVAASDSLPLETSEQLADARQTLLAWTDSLSTQPENAYRLERLNRAQYGIRYKLRRSNDSLPHTLDLIPSEIEAIVTR